MKMSTGAAIIASAMLATAPAYAAHHHHKGHMGSKMTKGSATTEDLNKQSLAKARAGMQPSAPETPPAATPSVPAGTGETAPPAAAAPAMPPPTAPQ